MKNTKRKMRPDLSNPGRCAVTISAICTAAIFPVMFSIISIRMNEYVANLLRPVVLLLIAVGFVLGLLALCLLPKCGWRGILIPALVTTSINGLLISVKFFW